LNLCEAFQVYFAVQNNSKMTHLQPGDPAPAFSGLDQHGKTVSLDQFRGQRVVLYFYPKDDTPGCTAEACDFRDNHQALAKAGTAVIGVSADSVKSHLKFAEKYNLPFPLLADENKAIIQAYGVWGKKKFMGREYDGIHRETFVIGADGTIEKVITKVETKNPVAQINP
jgi:peroxiredoxin Q/BCP